MAKVKNKRNFGLADKVRKKRQTETTKKVLNPFEVHVNREKFKVLGRKLKHDRGLPGVSRGKAIQKRKETLGTEMKLINKTNKFVDRRIGETDSRLSGEDKVLARFAAEQAKRHSKKNIYNLADDVLTHRGQTLEDIEKFDDPRSSDEEDDDGRRFNSLGGEFVSEGHFGGGVLSKTDNKDGAKSHKDLIEQLIAESKKRKAEKQKLKEQTLDLTEKLDTDWKDLQPIVFKGKRDEGESVIDKLLSKETKKGEDYDKMMRELRFEKRGTPSDGLQSEEKTAKQDREKLEQLERERLERMQPAIKSNINSKPGKHRSADDLDDNFDLDEEPTYMVSYDAEGKPLLPKHILEEHSLKKKKVEFDNGISDSEDDDNGEEEESEESEEDSLEDLKGEESEKESGDDNNEQDSDDDDAMDENKSSDLENDSLAVIPDTSRLNPVDVEEAKEVRKLDKAQKGNLKCEETNNLKRKNTNEEDQKNKKSKLNEKEVKGENSVDKVSKIKRNTAENIAMNIQKVQIDLEESKLPYTFEMPEEYEQLEELLSGHTPREQSVILERLIKCYHPSLAEQNKELLSKLFAYLLQYINDLFSNLSKEDEVKKAFCIFDKIVPFMYDLAQHNVMNAKHCLTEVITEKYEDYKNNPKTIPDLDTLIFFKLVSLIFPTSDFRHPVVTPCLVFMSELLTRCKFKTGISIAKGLLITALILEYTVLSKRFVPSAINFIRGVIFYSANNSLLNPVELVPPFRVHSKQSKLLKLEEDCSEMAAENKMAAKDLVNEEITTEFKIRSFSTAVDMLKEMFTNSNDLETQACMFEPHIHILGLVGLENYPDAVSRKVSEVMSYMKATLEMKTYTPLAREKKRPKALKLYEPDVQDVFTGAKSTKLSREQVETNKLKVKLRRETKGALREIRRDKAFVGAVKLRQKIQSDEIRKRKVKEIYRDAAVQQGELNKLKRQK